jgi:phosphatidylinositol alpha-mannosyltransferase
MRIAQVTEFYAPITGGIGEHVRHLSRELRRLGHDVRVVTGQAAPAAGAPIDAELERHTQRFGSPVRFAYNGGLASVTFGRRLPQQLDAFLEREGFDIVHTHNPMMPILPLLALDRSRAVNVGTFHSFHQRDAMIRMWRWVLQSRMRRLDLAIAVSAAAQRAYRMYFDTEFEIVPNGIDLQAYAPNGRHPLPNGQQTLLFVGQMVPKKGLPTLLDAFEMLLDDLPQLRLRVVGDGPMAGAYRQRLGRRARAQVEFVGSRHGAALADEYRACDVFCAPSIGHESFGITLLEAMAAGKPIVAADIDGYREVVRDGREAILHARADPRDLRDAVKRVVLDGGLRADLVQHGRRRVQDYAWSTVARRVEVLYERLLGAGPGPRRQARTR